MINLDHYKSVGTNWIALCVNGDNATYFDGFRAQYIPKEIKTFIGNKNITANIFRIQTYVSVMCGPFCIGFIDFMLIKKRLADFTNLFSPNSFKKNGKTILKHF